MHCRPAFFIAMGLTYLSFQHSLSMRLCIIQIRYISELFTSKQAICLDTWLKPWYKE